MGSVIQLRGTLDRFEGHAGVLLFDDTDLLGTLAGQELVLPIKILPAGTKQGDQVVVELFSDEQATQAREVIARQVLEDILNGK
ncbi:DUF3006 domain-containing protein [Candidatus Berkelbacteria bacterium]|nr:DUF3006 domain-containing protein [Candidatus Berkelbacteria bacterium]